jgi:hypothetical protein
MPVSRKSDQSSPRPVSVTGVTHGRRCGALDVDKAFVTSLPAALGPHRAWERAPKEMAAAVPPPGRSR